VDEYGRTALLVAHGDAAEKLLAAGANLRATDKDGMGPLHYAHKRARLISRCCSTRGSLT
jgi:ankyrin repeat protein